jgi:lysophospholipase L1-like esterase
MKISNSLIKKLSFWIIFLVLAVVVIEFFGHLLFRFIKGEFVWEDVYKQNAVFNIREFTELVSDGRLVTNKKNFKIELPWGNWSIETDSNGFRLGANNYFRKKDNIVFLGDSVLFGWGVNGDQSVPSKFYKLMKNNFSVEYGVINAAIPSYSLYQAVKRYEHEIYGKFPVRYVVLQIYDPVSQFLIWGREWRKTMSWTSKDTLVYTRAMAKKHNFLEALIYKYSFIYHVVYKLKLRLKTVDNSFLLLKNDREAFGLFERENLSVLDDFYNLLKKENIVLIFLPVNPAGYVSTYNTTAINNLDIRSKASLFIIDHLNKILREFASSHKNVYYFDVVSYFDKIGRKGLFIDPIHLSEYGAEKQAEFIFGKLRINNLLNY